MLEKIRKLAAAMTRPSEEETPVLEALCETAMIEAAGRLRDGSTPEMCEELFCCAAALLAAAGLFASRSGGGVASFTAGDVSVRMAGDGCSAAETAAALRRQAACIMAYYWGDDDFAFRGVRG